MAIKYHMAICKSPEFRVRQDEPYNSKQIKMLEDMYSVSFINTQEVGDFKFYLFKRKLGDDKHDRSN
jgi:hypothetical protein